MNNKMVKIQIIKQEIDKKVTLENYLDMDENERGLAYFVEQKKNNELKSNLNGIGKHLNTGEVVDKLEIEGLTTTIYNKWLCANNYGELRRAEGQKVRYFHPNENFISSIVKNGYAQNGLTSTGKPKVSYRPEFIDKLKRDDIIESLQQYVQQQG